MQSIDNEVTHYSAIVGGFQAGSLLNTLQGKDQGCLSMAVSTYAHFSDKELAVLRDRAKRIARLAQDNGEAEVLTVLAVSIGDERYALPIESITNVYEGMSITRVPGVPPGVAGVVNIRGRITLVLDLRTLLGVPGETTESYLLVALADDSLDLALRVDSLRDVERIAAAGLTPASANTQLRNASHIRGLFPDGQALLDLTSIIHDPSLAAPSSAV
jgi:purine-binding chemotaxis protein CheW